MAYRLKADPLVGVRELETVFVSFLKKQPEKDIFSVLSSSRRIDWKTAPALDLLGDAKVAELFSGLFKAHGNGVISKAKLKKALSCTQNEYFRMNHSKMHDDDYIDLADERIRILASQYRDLKKLGDHYDRTMRKASSRQKDIIDEVLSILTLEPCSRAREEKDNLLSTAIVPYIPPETLRPADSKPAQQSSSSSGIFKRILGKRISSPKPEKVLKLEDQQKVTEVKEQQNKKEEPFRFGAESSSEQEEIPAMLAEALNLKSKTEDVEKKKVAVKKVEVEDKVRKKPAEFELSKDEEDMISLAMSEKFAETSKDKSGKEKKGSKEKKTGKKKGTEKKDTKSVGKKDKQQSVGEHKSSKRRRVKDSAYHRARNAARLAGCSPGTSKLKAREAANEAAMLFDAKVQN